MLVAFKTLHIFSMFLATSFAIGPIAVFYLLARAGNAAVVREAMRFDTMLERLSGGF